MSLSATIKNNFVYSASLAACLTLGLSGCGSDKKSEATTQSSSSSSVSSASSISSSSKPSTLSSSSLSSLSSSSLSLSSLSSSSLSSLSSSSAPAIQLKAVRIWPVGDSITAGASNNWGVWNKEIGGYRRNLMALLNDGYTYETIGGAVDTPAFGDLPTAHSGYRGEGLSVLGKAEFSPAKIKENNPDVVLVMLGINSLGSKKEYPDSQGQYWSKNGNHFNNFFVQYKAFIDKVLANDTNAVVFIGKLPPIGDTRFYHDNWDDKTAPNPTSGWTTVGDGSVNPKDIVPEFNTELQALYDTYYKDNTRVVIVDLNTGMKVGDKWEDDVNILGVPQNWWNGDGLHPTYYGYSHIAERWNTAIRKAFPPTAAESTILYSVDCGAIETTDSFAGGVSMIKGSMQSVVWDKKYGPDATTGKNWGHIGDANWDKNPTAPASATMWFAWQGDKAYFDSVATSTTGNSLVYRFEVPANQTYRVHLGFRDKWGDEAKPAATTRQAKVYIDGTLKGTHNYKLNSFGSSIYEAANTTGTLEVKVEGTSDNALLDSIVIQRLY